MPKGNQGSCRITLFDVQGQRAVDPQTNLTFLLLPGAQAKRLRGHDFSSGDPEIPLPAFPQTTNIQLTVQPKRFLEPTGVFFALSDGEQRTFSFTVFRRQSEWNARFVKWASLGSSFEGLKKLLKRSPRITLLGPDSEIGSFITSRYDDVDTAAMIHAKASLLNIHAKLSGLRAPAVGRLWFDYLEEVRSIGLERIVAQADPLLFQHVKNAASSGDYRAVSPALHLRNFPADTEITEIASIKSRIELGNLQITVARCRTEKGEVTIADCDIDEHGDLWRHFGDLVRHKFTGGTHPFDIHEFLLLAQPQIDLGYTLV